MTAQLMQNRKSRKDPPLNERYVKQLPLRMVRASFVRSISDLRIDHPDLITAFKVTTQFGRTNVLALRPSDDTQRLIGSVHIRSVRKNAPSITDDRIALLNENPMLMRFSSAGPGSGIAAHTRIPLFSERAVSEVLEQVIGFAVELQWSLLIARLEDKIESATHAEPMEVSPRELASAYQRVRNAICPLGYTMRVLDSDRVVLSRGNDLACAGLMRIEISKGSLCPIFGRMVCADLIVPYQHEQRGSAQQMATVLNRREEILDDMTLGIGAWHVGSEHGSLRYRIRMPLTGGWLSYLDLFVSSLVMRWEKLEKRTIEEITLPDSHEARSRLFLDCDETMVEVRADDASVEAYVREMEARKHVAQVAGVSLRSVSQILGPPPEKPAQLRRLQRPPGSKR
jgi:hypothetical protein